MLVNLAVLQEQIAAAIPDREALVFRGRVITYADFTARTRQAAQAFRRLGLGCRTERAHLPNWASGQDHVAVYCYNGPEYLETMYGAYKARATSININYRYKAEELVYVLGTGEARALVYHACFAPTVAVIRAQLPQLRHLIQVADDSGERLLPGALDYEALLAAERPELPDLPYAPDDLYILYTGGTTGMPKGVLWRHEDVYYNGLGGHIPGFSRIDTEEQLLAHINLGIGGRTLNCLPYMHGAGQWNAFNTFHRGGTVVMPDEVKRLDAHAVLRTIEAQRCDMLMLIGDAFARPLLAALKERAYDLSSLRMLSSTAAVLSTTVKDELLAAMPDGIMLLESIGGSELGLQAMSYDTTSGEPGLPAYPLRDNTVLIQNARRGIVPASAVGEIGWTASTGHLPLGYLGDEEKTRATFPVIDGVRYSVGGDRARYLPDGRVVFLGRESSCINTGGEKVFAEEVERVVKSHPAVYDALVVGMPSTRWGQEVTAVVALQPGHRTLAADDLRVHCAPHLADYKVPKAVVIAPEIARSPSGKPDYAWAKQHAAAALEKRA